MNKHRFVWHDLNTRDVEGAKKFYGELFNWKFSADDHGPYVHISAGDRMIGGMRQQTPQEPGPPNWLGYVGVDDVAACVSTVQSAGGRVHMPLTKIPNAGTFAVTADPTGGVFAPWKSDRAGEDREQTGKPPLFTFVWDELVSTDPSKAAAFYAKVFGWQPRPMDMGGGMTYTLLDRPGTDNGKGQPIGAGGIMKNPPGVQQSFWIAYVGVDNTDKQCQRCEKLGGKVMVPPQDIPNVGRFACWSDPQGAAIAVIAS
jgi:predicted enzyme related to lactoylglutathione lyase